MTTVVSFGGEEREHQRYKDEIKESTNVGISQPVINTIFKSLLQELKVLMQPEVDLAQCS